MRKFEFKRKENLELQRKFNYEQTVELFIDDKRLQKRSEKTIKTYRQTLCHFGKYCADNGYTGAEDDCVRAYVRWLTFEKTKWDDHPTNHSDVVGVSARTVNNALRVLRVFYNWAVKKRLINASPAQQVGLQTEDVDTFEIFTDAEIESLLAAPRRRTYTGLRDYTLMALIADTGMRVGEMTALVRNDFDLVYRQIILRAEITKNRKARIVPISRTTADLLRELFDYIGIDDPNSEEFVFLTQYGDQLIGDNFAKNLKKYARRSLVPIKARVSPHTFRHYFAIKFLRNGGDPFALMKILGHTDISMTQKYVRYASADLQEVHDKASPIESLTGKRNKPRGNVKFR
ncbi:tyrosine-type recombinase/integrase [Sporosarcina sp. SAFN-015]|uniref:tyrosine-type recombinase/integrase n=1 Tax=Sporosarcina sp. SAFN-015 TaxID=3387274 RepID=UPI003F7F1093